MVAAGTRSVYIAWPQIIARVYRSVLYACYLCSAEMARVSETRRVPYRESESRDARSRGRNFDDSSKKTILSKKQFFYRF